MDYRKKMLTEALLNTNGSNQEVSKYIGVCDRTIRNWLNKYPELKNLRSYDANRCKIVRKQLVKNGLRFIVN